MSEMPAGLAASIEAREMAVFWRLLSTRVSTRSFSSTTSPERTRPSRRAIVCDWYSLRISARVDQARHEEVEIAPIHPRQLGSDILSFVEELMADRAVLLEDQFAADGCLCLLRARGRGSRRFAVSSRSSRARDFSPERFQTFHEGRITNLGDELDVRGG